MREVDLKSDHDQAQAPIICSVSGANTRRRVFTVLGRRVCSSATEESQPKPQTRSNSASSIFFIPVNQQIHLTQYGLMAELHWREFRPTMVKEMEAKGTLQEALFEAQETTLDEMETLCRKLETEQKLTPQQAHDQAWEMIREKYILLPPEENLSG